MKRGIIMSDTHSGHLVGLTPPGWQVSDTNPMLGKFARYQRESWNWWTATVAKLPPLDFIVMNGDAVEGSGRRSGGTELISSDWNAQKDMAIGCIQVPKRKLKRGGKIVMTYGTAYHVGDDADYELDIANVIGAKIGSHEWLTVEGVTFDLKHHIGSSSVPHGRNTSQERDRVWSDIWADLGRTPKSQVIIRSHVHYHKYSGDARTLMMTTPALQGYGTKYGARRCSGVVDIGFVYFECHKGTYSWRSFILEPSSLKATSIKL